MEVGEKVVFEDELGELREGVIVCKDAYGTPERYGIEDGEGAGLYSRSADEIVPADGEEQYAIPVDDSDDEYYVYPIM